MATDYFHSFEKIKVGDRVYTNGRGPCSGGAPYGLYDKVVKVTDREIITTDGAYNRRTGNASRPPWAYYISYWRKKTKSKRKK